MTNTKVTGDRTEAEIMCCLVHGAETVLLPFGENQAYDMAFDMGNGKIYRVQCKTGQYREGSLVFSVRSVYKKGGVMISVPTRAKVDFFGVHCPGLGNYLVPAGLVGSSMCSLRVDDRPARGGSIGREACDYAIEKVLLSLNDGVDPAG